MTQVAKVRMSAEYASSRSVQSSVVSTRRATDLFYLKIRVLAKVVCPTCTRPAL